MDIKIGGVVVLYNPTLNVIENIKTYIDNLDVLFVVDNSNNDDFGKYINDKKIIYISNNKNIGIAEALNIGANKSLEENCNWLLTMDQDSKFNSNTFNEMKEYIINNNTKNIGIVTPYQKIKSSFLDKNLPKIDFPDIVMTSGNLVNLSAYKKVDGFKEYFFIDAVDKEFCYNLLKNNYKIVRLNYVSIDHNLGDIEIHKFLGKKIVCTNHNYIRRYYIARNNLYFFKLYGKHKYSILLPIRDQIIIIFKIMLFEKDKYRKIRNINRGMRDYFTGVTGEYKYKN